MSWREDVEREVREAVERLAAETREAWATGTPPAGLSDVVLPELDALQYHEAGREPWRGGREAWVSGTAEAAAHFVGSDATWEVDEIVVLPRSEDEAAVSYRVTNRVGDRASRALFLETWVRREGRWSLLRHTGELAEPT